MLASAPEVFGNGKDREHEKIELERDRLYKKVDQLLPHAVSGTGRKLKADAPHRVSSTRAVPRWAAAACAAIYAGWATG